MQLENNTNRTHLSRARLSKIKFKKVKHLGKHLHRVKLHTWGKGCGWNSVIGRLPSKSQALDSIPGTENKNKTNTQCSLGYFQYPRSILSQLLLDRLN